MYIVIFCYNIPSTNVLDPHRWLASSHRMCCIMGSSPSLKNCLFGVRKLSLVHSNVLLSNRHLAYSQFGSKIIRIHKFVIGVISKQEGIHVQESVSTVNKRLRKQKGLSRMDNPETLATFSTQDTGRRKTKRKNSKHKAKQISNTNPNKNRG